MAVHKFYIVSRSLNETRTVVRQFSECPLRLSCSMLARLCAVIAISLSFSNASLGSIRVTHTGARYAWDYEGVDFVVTRRGTLVIECDSYGNSVRVYRSGEKMLVTEFNPGGAVLLP
jgi:hypothetical protein